MQETYKIDLHTRPTKETCKRNLQKRPAKETYNRKRAMTTLKDTSTLASCHNTSKSRSIICKKDLRSDYTRDLQKEPTKETYKRDLQKRQTTVKDAPTLASCHNTNECVLLCFIKPILGNRYGPGVSSRASQGHVLLFDKKDLRFDYSLVVQGGQGV